MKDTSTKTEQRNIILTTILPMLAASLGRLFKKYSKSILKSELNQAKTQMTRNRRLTKEQRKRRAKQQKIEARRAMKMTKKNQRKIFKAETKQIKQNAKSQLRENLKQHKEDAKLK